MTTKLALLGAGKIGDAIVNLLGATGDFEITVADRDAARIGEIAAPNVRAVEHDGSDEHRLRALLAGHDVVVSAAPFYLTPKIAAAAKAAGAHYFDLTEDVASTRAVKALADGAGTALVPQCGLAPGYVSIVAQDLARGFDTLRDVQMRVGALPIYPTNALKYNLTWSTDGLINEYCNPCEAIIDGELRETLALEETEAFSLDGIAYEAFNTSGGLGTLCDTLAGRVENLNYKTVRYPGHRDIVKLLIRDLRLGQRRDAAEGRSRNRDSDHAAGRGADLRHGERDARRAIDAAHVRQEDLQPDGEWPAPVGDPADDGGRRVRDGRPAARRQAAAMRIRAPGTGCAAGFSRQPFREVLCVIAC